MDTCRASRYFVRRRKSCTKVQELVAYSTYPKLEMICDCSWHLIIGADVVLGPCVDVNTFRKLLFGALGRVSIETILADAGYDSESNHRFARDGCGVRRPTQRKTSGHAAPQAHEVASRLSIRATFAGRGNHQHAQAQPRQLRRRAQRPCTCE